VEQVALGQTVTVFLVVLAVLVQILTQLTLVQLQLE
jgi:hypothetical protein